MNSATWLQSQAEEWHEIRIAGRTRGNEIGTDGFAYGQIRELARGPVQFPKRIRRGITSSNLNDDQSGCLAQCRRSFASVDIPCLRPYVLTPLSRIHETRRDVARIIGRIIGSLSFGDRCSSGERCRLATTRRRGGKKKRERERERERSGVVASADGNHVQNERPQTA